MNGIATYVLLMLLRGYKCALSPMLPPACRYVPTCSEYAIEAVDRYGALRGSALAVWRLLHCHPFARGGFDPVPIPIGDGVQTIGAHAACLGPAIHVRPSAVSPATESHA